MSVIDLEEWKHARSCQCKLAVLRAYDELLKRNEPLRVAREAAVVVYRYHHPEVSFDGAVETVAGWVRARGAGGAG